MKDELLTPTNDDSMLYADIDLIEKLNEMNTPSDKLLLLIDDYYGDSRDMGHKEEIREFIETHAEYIRRITEEYLK